MADVPGWFACRPAGRRWPSCVDERFPARPGHGRHAAPPGRRGPVRPGVRPTLRAGPRPRSAADVDQHPAGRRRRRGPSTVKVQGVACRRIQEGSGFVAGPGPDRHQRPRRGGGGETVVQRSDGSEVRATGGGVRPRAGPRRAAAPATWIGPPSHAVDRGGGAPVPSSVTLAAATCGPHRSRSAHGGRHRHRHLRPEPHASARC